MPALRGVRVDALSRVYETAPVGGPPQDPFLNAVVAIDTDLDPYALLALAQQLEQRRATRARRTVRAAHLGRRRALVRRRSRSTIPTSPSRTPACGSGASCSRRCATSRPTSSSADAAWKGVREAAVQLRGWKGSEPLALIGPGRAGTTISLGLVEQGWTVVAVAGRAPDAASTVAAAACLAAPPGARVRSGARCVARHRGNTRPCHRASSDGRRTGDRAGRARSCTSPVHAGSMCSTRCSRSARAFVSARSTRCNRSRRRRSAVERLPGAWAAVAGDPAVTEIARPARAPHVRDRGRRPGRVSHRGRRWRRITWSRCSARSTGWRRRCGVPFEAFAPLVLSSVQNAFSLGPSEALTGPVQRGDLATVEQHLRELDPAERDAYRALAREAARLDRPPRHRARPPARRPQGRQPARPTRPELDADLDADRRRARSR